MFRHLVSAAVLLALPRGCSMPVVAQPPELRASLDQALLDWAEIPRHRGVSAAVVFPNGTEWTGVAGVEAAAVPLRSDHLIWIASITKTMTGAVILQLVEEDRLGLDDPVSRWLPAMPNIDPQITVRQLLDHSNGLANYTANQELWAQANAEVGRRFTADELLAHVGPPAFERGERTQYTNTAFVLLGRIAEEVTGLTLPQLWTGRLFEPLGLTGIFLPGLQDPPGPVATAWINRVTDEARPLDHLSVLSLGSWAFGLFADAPTVARWGRALFAGNVLGPEMRSEMVQMRPAAGNIPGESGTGLGIRGYGYLDREQWGHSGGSPFGSSLLLHDPETRITVAVLMNQGGGGDHFDLAPKLLEIAGGGTPAGR